MGSSGIIVQIDELSQVKENAIAIVYNRKLCLRDFKREIELSGLNSSHEDESNSNEVMDK